MLDIGAIYAVIFLPRVLNWIQMDAVYAGALLGFCISDFEAIYVVIFVLAQYKWMHALNHIFPVY